MKEVAWARKYIEQVGGLICRWAAASSCGGALKHELEHLLTCDKTNTVGLITLRQGYQSFFSFSFLNSLSKIGCLSIVIRSREYKFPGKVDLVCQG